MPDWVRDYVMVHELMHLRRMDHSKQFWKLVAAACPDYERARAWLRANTSSGGSLGCTVVRDLRAFVRENRRRLQLRLSPR